MGLYDPHPFNFVDLENKNLQIDNRTILLGSIFLLLLIIGSLLSFIYFLYTCLRRGQSRIPGPTASPVVGLDKATIDCLPIVSYGSTPSPSCRVGECSICLGGFQEGEKVKVLPLCHHGFHSDCVNKWLQTRSSCPLCRAAVVRVDSLSQLDIP